eukprot:CAMPEP_0201285778 /NCGR_PEP_ID=MMETSP1317-20130820/113809_1 /ASSEMBLY_ACC=CAM_ASM_000770 /TAXON_ID=187299 /ORGANISM="Undescribed Undescribed, Strain Undescribed" /LENGTH=63 /DNA_ID=CAMNT_0047611709 /DNA_START=60 /DNA_END=251 /DNA_ORIENTATION=+
MSPWAASIDGGTNITIEGFNLSQIAAYNVTARFGPVEAMALEWNATHAVFASPKVCTPQDILT